MKGLQGLGVYRALLGYRTESYALECNSEGANFTCDTDDDGDGDGTMWYKKVDTNAQLGCSNQSPVPPKPKTLKPKP